MLTTAVTKNAQPPGPEPSPHSSLKYIRSLYRVTQRQRRLNMHLFRTNPSKRPQRVSARHYSRTTMDTSNKCVDYEYNSLQLYGSGPTQGRTGVLRQFKYEGPYCRRVSKYDKKKQYCMILVCMICTTITAAVVLYATCTYLYCLMYDTAVEL